MTNEKQGLFRVAVDIGGTFTDLQVLNETSGATYAHKTSTTPDDPARGLLTGLQEAARAIGFRFDQVSWLMHGTTIATNAVLQRTLAKGALITTAGFEDVLAIGRHVRKEIYSSRAESRTVLIPRNRRYGIVERVSASGEVTRPLQEDRAVAIARQLAETDVDAIAICLLHAYANPSHEQRLGQIFASEMPAAHVSLSSAVSPEIREFERTSTTVLNALLMPVVTRYLANLRERLQGAGFAAPVYLLQSNGGVTTPEAAAEQPARLLLSGPSGGALAASTLSSQLTQPNLIAADMGGTSFDVSVVHQGELRVVTQGEVADCPVRLPMVEIRTIGAGGGSIAGVDAAGRLHVGPQSAGADPGPVAYRRGGKQPTVTDANAALGRLDPEFFLGGGMALDVAAAKQAIAGAVAQPLSLADDTAAAGVLAVANTKMAAAIKLSLFEKGLDPEDFALLAFGGAGGLHAVEVAAALGIKRIVFPLDPGTLSAWGMLFADIGHDFARSFPCVAEASALGGLAGIARELRFEGDGLLARDGVEPARREFRLALDMRYPGQAYEIVVPWIEPEAAMLEHAVKAFHDLHQAQYAHADRGVTPEVVTVRLTAVGILDKPKARVASLSTAAGSTNGKQKSLFLDGAWQQVPVLHRSALSQQAAIDGPILLQETHSTLLLPHGWQARLAQSGALIVDHLSGH